MIIGASYTISLPIGLGTTIAVVLHEIPQEIGDFGVFVYAGYTPRKALLLNFLSALSAFAGALISLWIGPNSHAYSIVLMPIAAGGFIYIAGSDLIPELQGCEEIPGSFLQLGSIILGIFLMALLRLLD